MSNIIPWRRDDPPPVTPESIAAAQRACEQERRENGIEVDADGTARLTDQLKDSIAFEELKAAIAKMHFRHAWKEDVISTPTLRNLYTDAAWLAVRFADDISRKIAMEKAIEHGQGLALTLLEHELKYGKDDATRQQIVTKYLAGVLETLFSFLGNQGYGPTAWRHIQAELDIADVAEGAEEV